MNGMKYGIIRNERQEAVAKLIYLPSKQIGKKTGIGQKNVERIIRVMRWRAGVTSSIGLARVLMSYGFAFDLQYLENRDDNYDKC